MNKSEPIARHRNKALAESVRSINTAAFVFAAVLLCFVATAQSAEFHPHELRVVLKKSGIKVGKSTATLTLAAENEIAARQEYKPGVALKVFGERKYVQDSVLEITADGVRTKEFTVDGGKEKSTHVRFNYADRTLTFQDGSEQPMPDHEIYDLLGWHVALMLSKPESLPGKTLSIIEEREVSTYVFESVEKESVEHDSREFVAYKLMMQDQEKDNRGYEVWLAPELNNLPVRMKRYKYNTSVTVEPKKIEWLE